MQERGHAQGCHLHATCDMRKPRSANLEASAEVEQSPTALASWRACRYPRMCKQILPRSLNLHSTWDMRKPRSANLEASAEVEQLPTALAS